MGKNGTVVTDSKAEGKLKLVKRPPQVDLPPTPGGGKWNLNRRGLAVKLRSGKVQVRSGPGLVQFTAQS